MRLSLAAINPDRPVMTADNLAADPEAEPRPADAFRRKEGVVDVFGHCAGHAWTGIGDREYDTLLKGLPVRGLPAPQQKPSAGWV